MTDYSERLVLPIDSSEDVQFYTPTGLLVARGYVRVELGGRGPYIEFIDEQIVMDSIHVPEDQEWRFTDEGMQVAYYLEYRTNDSANVKLYRQLKTVDYADYRIGCWYISPFLLTSDKYPTLVKPLQNKQIVDLFE